MSRPNPFRYFKTSPEIIRLAVMLYVRFPLSLRNVEDLLHERGVDVSHETIRFWWHRFGPMFAAEIRKRRIEGRPDGHVDQWLCQGNLACSGAGRWLAFVHDEIRPYLSPIMKHLETETG